MKGNEKCEVWFLDVWLYVKVLPDYFKYIPLLHFQQDNLRWERKGEGLKGRGGVGTKTGVFCVNWEEDSLGTWRGVVCADVAHPRVEPGPCSVPSRVSPSQSDLCWLSGGLFVPVLPKELLTTESSQWKPPLVFQGDCRIVFCCVNIWVVITGH